MVGALCARAQCTTLSKRRNGSNFNHITCAHHTGIITTTMPFFSILKAKVNDLLIPLHLKEKKPLVIVRRQHHAFRNTAAPAASPLSRSTTFTAESPLTQNIPVLPGVLRTPGHRGQRGTSAAPCGHPRSPQGVRPQGAPRTPPRGPSQLGSVCLLDCFSYARSDMHTVRAITWHSLGPRPYSHKPCTIPGALLGPEATVLLGPRGHSALQNSLDTTRNLSCCFSPMVPLMQCRLCL